MMNTMTRRSLLGAGAAGLAGLATAGCAPSSTSGGGEPTPGAVAEDVFPAYQPATAAEPDAEGTNGGMPLFLNYPADPQPFYSEAPGSGGTVSAFADLNGATPPTPIEENPRWAELNERLNVELTFDPVASQDFAAKLATIVAGGDLPDLVQLKPDTLQRLPEVLEQVFTDLSEFLSGDAVADYPSLANFPTLSWRGGAQAGKIYAVPQPRGLLNSAFMIRQDLFEEKGLPISPATGEEFLEICQEFTDERNGRWALSHGPGLLTMLHQMYGAPNTWSFADGVVTHMYETEQFKESLVAASKIWKSGVMHPDAWSSEVTVAANWFFNESAPIMPGVNWGNIYAYTRLDAGQTDGLKVGLTGPVGMEGHDPTYWIRHGFWGFTAVPKTDPERAQELLRIMDYLASPFGSEEWLFLNYGRAGVDYTLDGSNPIRTEEAGNITMPPSASITCAPQVMYQAGMNEEMERAHAYQEQWLAPDLQTVDPSMQYYSGEAMASGVGLAERMTQLAQDVALERKTIDEWDEGVQYWRDNGGDKIKAEYESALAAG